MLRQKPFEGPLAANRTLFVEGLIERSRGKPSKAVAKFRAALAGNPSLTLVRAELAQTLHEIGEDDGAKHHLELLMGEAPDAAAAAGIKSFIDRIDESRPYTISAYLSLAPSTNVNNGTSNDKIYLFGLPFDIDPQAKKQSGVGLSAGVSAGYSKRLNDDFSAVFGAGLNGRFYEDDEFNQLSASQSAELRRLHERGYVGFGIVASESTSGEDMWSPAVNYWSLGPRLGLSHQLDPKNRLNASSTVEFRTYDDSQSIYDGHAVLNDVALSHAFDASLIGYMGAGLDRVVTESDHLDYWSPSLSIGFYKEWTWGVTTDAQIEGRLSKYDDVFPLMAGPREDERLGARLSLTKRDFDIWGYAPVIEYSYTLNSSNVAFYDYDSHTIDFRLTKDF